MAFMYLAISSITYAESIPGKNIILAKCADFDFVEIETYSPFFDGKYYPSHSFEVQTRSKKLPAKYSLSGGVYHYTFSRAGKVQEVILIRDISGRRAKYTYMYNETECEFFAKPRS